LVKHGKASAIADSGCGAENLEKGMRVNKKKGGKKAL